MTSKCVDLDLLPLNQLSIDISKCVYTSCYCEENIWKLCETISQLNAGKHLNNCYAVFISNHKQVVPIWKQKAGKEENSHLVFWDYHVIMLFAQNGLRSLVYDFDSVLPFPCDYDAYSKQTFRDEDLILEQYHRLFRVIPAKQYLEKFSSDRSRMKRLDGTWIKPPPDYPCIQRSVSISNLDDFISMDAQSFAVGSVLSLKELNAKFSHNTDTTTSNYVDIRL